MTGALPSTRIVPLSGHGPEDVVADRGGRLFTGLEDGRILMSDDGGGSFAEVARVAGRPLGLDASRDGTLLICDSPNGLLEADLATRRIRTLVSHDGARPLPFCSNVVTAPDGDIFFTVSAMRHTVRHWRRDMIEAIPTGRAYRLSPGGVLTCLADDLSFANGLALASDGSHLIVAESGAMRLQRLFITGPRSGTRALFADLPGYPDNMGAANGEIWVAIAAPPNPALRAIRRLPHAARWIAARIPDALQPAPARVAQVMAFTEAGRLVHDYRWTDGRYAMVTSVCRVADTIWCGSLQASALLSFPADL
jgi:sugar lactone lactonase YvrE